MRKKNNFLGIIVKRIKKGHFGFIKNGKSMKKGRKGSRKMRGGMSALSPSDYDGKGVGTSGVDLQFVAGNAN